MTYATHLIRGRVNPNAISDTWNYQLHSVSPQKTAELLLNHIRNESVALGLEDLNQPPPQYALMKKKLAFYSSLHSTQRATISLKINY